MSGRAATTGVIPGRFGLSVGKPDIEPPEGWRWTRLTDVARLETGHTPSRRKPHYWDGDVPWIGIKDARLYHGRVIPDTIQHTTPLGIENSAARVLPAGTVCLSRTASIGYVTRMGQPMATSQDFVNWVCSDELDPKFLMSLLIAETDSLNYFSHGSTHQTIYFPEVKAFHVCLPPLDEQRRIAAVLGVLDDRIEVNRRMNRTLEAMAQALFRSRFVDFEGREDLVESEAGAIPSGWRWGKLAEEFKLTMGSSPPGSTYNEEGEGLPFYQGATDFEFRYPCRRVYCTEPKRIAQPNDTLVSVRAPVGRTNMAIEKCCVGRGVAAIRHKSGARSFTYAMAKHLEQQFEVFNAEGTVFGSINKKDFSNLKVTAPPDEEVDNFEAIVGPLDQKIEVNERNIRTLADLRDALLPRLVSGELRVPEAEEAAEAVM